MGRFNLLDEAWIPVIVDSKGRTREVSLKEFFENSHHYKGLAGDMETQNFALMRVLLAVMHTVFSRFNANGEEYAYFDLDERFKQTEEIEEEDLDDYIDNLYRTWLDLWERKQFPKIIGEYLEKWRDRFYLFDKEHPFFQVRFEDITEDKISKSKASSVSGGNINRLISESGNKIALFSPKYKANENKNKLSEAEIIRWILTFQAYTGLSDKVIFGKEKYKNSKGWLFDLGGIYFKTGNLFTTLMLNFMIVQKENDNLVNIQRPCWEYDSNEVIEGYFDKDNMDNISSLYTAWSRAIYINPDIDIHLPFECFIVKLPEINHQNKFIEPMTVWNYNKNGENKDTCTPKKHQLNKAMWRSFGLIVGIEETGRTPGIMDWMNKVQEIAEKKDKEFITEKPMLCAISMKDDGNATSWVPTDEIMDYLVIDDYILTDLQEKGWAIRINDVVNETKKIIGFVFKTYISDIKKIRNVQSDTYVSQKVETLYFKVDNPFRQWLASLSVKNDKDEKIKEWRTELKKMVKLEAEDLLSEAAYRDYKGIEEGGEIKNIATAYNYFMNKLNQEIPN